MAENVYALLVEICETDVEARPGNLSNLRHMLQQVLKDSAVMSSRIRAGILRTSVADLPDDAIRALHTDLRDLLRYVAQTGKRLVPVTVQLAPQPDGTVWVFGTARDVVLGGVLTLLNQPGGAPIAACPECGAVFQRVRRQKYCSRRCVNRVNMRTHREKTPQKTSTTRRATTRRTGGR